MIKLVNLLLQHLRKYQRKLHLTFIFRERHLLLFQVATHLPIVAHLQHQIHIVAVLKVVVELWKYMMHTYE